jgi:hypothetical protein
MTRNRAQGASGTPRLTRIRRAAALALAAVIATFVTYDLVVFTPGGPQPTSAPEAAPARTYRHADFSGEHASGDARGIADWVVDSGDNQGMPFVIVDKRDSKVFVFNAAGHLTGASAALLGAAQGDHSVPGIGEKKISQIMPDERTTPAGRFVAEPGVNLNGERIVWVDYDAALSMHAVRAHNESERRLQRLASPTPGDNRISYGCINLPAKFFRDVVAPAFDGTRGIVYVLPETRPAHVVFGAYEVPLSAPEPSAVALSIREQ